MYPCAIEAQTMQPHRVSGALEQGGERELSARSVLEQCVRKYCRPGVDEGRDLLFGAFEQTTIRCHGKIATSGIADAAGRGRPATGCPLPSRVEKIGESRKIGFDTVDPDRIGIDVKERRIAELRQGFPDAASSPEQ